MERLPRMGIKVDMDMYRVLIHGCIVAGVPEDAHRILRVMEEGGLQVCGMPNCMGLGYMPGAMALGR